MTDKEQESHHADALVAAAYRVASIYARDFLYEYSSTLDPDGLHDDIISIIPADAEAKLRALMLKVAEKVSNIPRGKTYSIEDIVDEVLNESGSGANGGKK